MIQLVVSSCFLILFVLFFFFYNLIYQKKNDKNLQEIIKYVFDTSIVLNKNFEGFVNINSNISLDSLTTEISSINKKIIEYQKENDELPNDGREEQKRLIETYIQNNIILSEKLKKAESELSAYTTIASNNNLMFLDKRKKISSDYDLLKNLYNVMDDPLDKLNI